MLLKYHQKSIELLGVTPRISQSQVTLFDSFEEKYRVEIPASLREWYSIENSINLSEKILRTHTSIELKNTPGIQAKCGYLINDSDPFLIAIENQAVWFMAVKPDEGDNPPVYMRYNEPDESWVLHANSFSDWINALSWDYTVLSKLSLLTLDEYVVSATPEIHKKVSEFQVEAPETYGCNVYFNGSKFVRMKKGNKRLLVIYNDSST
jgi:hypothetical protein